MATSNKKKMQRNTFLFSFISLISFIYKMALAIIAKSLVLMIAALPTLFVYICKIIFVKNLFADKSKKKKSYLAIIIMTIIYETVFILFVVLKINGIDIAATKSLNGWLGLVMLLMMLVMFILSILGLKHSLEKSDIMVIGLKEITFIAALADTIFVVEFAYRIIQKYIEHYPRTLDTLANYYPLAVGIFMIIVSIKMINRYKSYSV